MAKVGFVYDDVFLGHKTPDWHPESPERLMQIVSELKRLGLMDKLIPVKPRKASMEDMAAVHTDRYLKQLEEIGIGCLDPETHILAGTIEAALYSSGAVFEAIDRSRAGEFRRAFCAVRPPGHHAEADMGMGFCIFNNVASGARYARRSGFNKVFIIDFDAHHGNGTQHIFEEDDTVFYFSTHQYPYYPDTGKESEIGKGKGEGYTYNVTIPVGSGNKDYLFVYQDILPGKIRMFDPDLVLVSAGYDIHINDPHADLRITSDGVRGVVDAIITSTTKPVIFVLEGGYDLPSLADSVRVTIEEMLKD